MQESLYNTIQKLKEPHKVNIEELEVILDSDIEEVVSLCKKACLKPKVDKFGDTYFSSDDVDILRKMKALYSTAQNIQRNSTEDAIAQKIIEQPESEVKDEEGNELTSPSQKVNFLTKAKNRLHNQLHQPMGIQGSLQKLEDNLINKISAILSEKMDGFDDIIVELIRAKTENENLRSQVNDLNRQVFILKKEISSFNPLPFGFYTKKENDEL